MAFFSKTILKVGELNANGETLKITPARIKNWVKGFKQLRANGQHVPMHWDHGDSMADLMPLSAAEFKKRKRSAKNTVGELVGVTPSKDGKSIEFKMELFRKDAIDAAKSNKVFVSPVIADSWTDGGKNKYSDVVTHADLVDHPVDHRQGPFVCEEAGTLACAVRLSNGSPKVFFMASDEYKKDDEEEPKVTEMSDDEPGDSEPESETDTEVVEDTAPEEPSGRDAKVQRAVQSLAKFGVQLAEDTDSSNFFERLDAAVIALDAADSTDDVDEEPTESEPMVATMSLRERSLFNHTQKKYRESLDGELQNLLNTGRITPAEFKAKSAGVKTVKLSLDGDGNEKPTALSQFIESRKAVPAGTMWKPEERLTKLSLVEVEQPKTGAFTKQEEDEAVSFMLKK